MEHVQLNSYYSLPIYWCVWLRSSKEMPALVSHPIDGTLTAISALSLSLFEHIFSFVILINLHKSVSHWANIPRLFHILAKEIVCKVILISFSAVRRMVGWVWYPDVCWGDGLEWFWVSGRMKTKRRWWI